MISAKEAKIRSIQAEAKLVGVNFKQIRHLKKDINIAVKKATKQGLFEVSIDIPRSISFATFNYLKSIFMAKCFFYELRENTLVVYWE